MNSPHLRFFGRIALAAGVLACALLPRAANADDPATFIAISPLYYHSTTYFNTAGKEQPSGCDFQKTGESIYVQQRLSASDEMHLSTEYDDVRCGGSSTRGLTDIQVDYLHGISGSAHPTQFSVEGSLIIPAGYSIAANPRLGLGRPGAALGAVYYTPFKAGSNYGYLKAEVNVRAYTGYPSPQLNTNVTAGLNLTPKLLVYESFYGETHLGAGGQLTNIGLNPTVNSSYNSYQLAENVAYNITPRTALVLNYTSLVGGSNTGIGSTVQAGVWLRF